LPASYRVTGLVEAPGELIVLLDGPGLPAGDVVARYQNDVLRIPRFDGFERLPTPKELPCAVPE
jgi:hypothetical protein